MNDIEPGLPAKNVEVKRVKLGHWQIKCQCPACSHRNTHSGGRGEEPRLGTFACHGRSCNYNYLVENPDVGNN